ncbi:sel1 repeat family protein [Vibrio mimicus]
MLTRILPLIAIVSSLSLLIYSEVSLPENTPLDYQQIKSNAEQGDRNAQYQLGLMLLQGQGVEADPTRALNWFHKAAQQGNPDAQYQIALQFQRDYKSTQMVTQAQQALQWLKMAANGGSSDAQTELGRWYVNGLYQEDLIVWVDVQAAETLFRQAIEQDNNDARYELARLLEANPNLVKKDDKLADLYRQPAEAGNTNAQYQLGRLYFEGKGVRKNETKALEWMQKAAQQRHVYAEFILGTYAERAGQIQEAITYYKRSSEQEFATAHAKLGLMYFNGRGINKDIKLAEFHLREGARLGNKVAQDHLVELLAEQGDAESQFYYGLQLNETLRQRTSNGQTVPDIFQPFTWYEKSALQGYAPAQNLLGSHYSSSDPEQGFMWYTKAAQQGFGPALWNVSKNYALGNGVEKNLVKGKMLQIVFEHHRLHVGSSGLEQFHNLKIPDTILTEPELNQAKTLANKCIERDYVDCL